MTQPSSTPKSASLSSSEIEKFSRQLILKGWSAALQLRIGELVVGVPEDLSFATEYLRALGVGQVVSAERSTEGYTENYTKQFTEKVDYLLQCPPIPAADSATERLTSQGSLRALLSVSHLIDHLLNSRPKE